MKIIASILLSLCTVYSFAQINYDAKDIEKVTLVITGDATGSNKNAQQKSTTLELGKDNIKKLVTDFNAMQTAVKGNAVYKQCALVIFYFKGGSKTLFYGNGKRFNEFTNGKSGNEYYTTTAWNLFEKYWNLKKEALCE